MKRVGWERKKNGRQNFKSLHYCSDRFFICTHNIWEKKWESDKGDYRILILYTWHQQWE